MNLKILAGLLLYYGAISLFFLFGASHLEGFSHNIAMNDSALSDPEIETGGFFTTGISFSRFFLFIGLGIGLSAPTFIQVTWSLITVLINVFTIGWIISSIWDG